MPYLTYSMLLYLPLHYNEINLAPEVSVAEHITNSIGKGACGPAKLKDKNWWTVAESNRC